MSISKSFALFAAVALAASPSVFARGDQPDPHQHATPAASASQPYAGQQRRGIKALSAQEQQDWLDGQGAGLAKSAELNGYPGPAHVLEFSAELALTAAQLEATRQLMAAHKAEVRALGQRLVTAEQALDEVFRQGSARGEDVSRLTRDIGALQARIRAAHLQTHIAQAALLQPRQVARYQQLRGYSE
jgi:hypothetical protein